MESNQIRLQLHYCFNDKELHSMNAEIHNECEKQFLMAIMHLNKYLDEPIIIDIIPSEEGGFIDIFILFINHPAALVLLTSLGTAFFYSKLPAKLTTSEETNIKIENISKLNEMSIDVKLTEEQFDYIVSDDKYLKKLKNSFFKTAKKERNIKQIQFTGTNIKDKVIIPTITVNYDDFDNLLEAVENDVEEIVTFERIYIVAPVLTRGRRLNWKGLWNGKPISFKLENSDYLEKVYSHQIRFTNGSFIDCELIVEKTINYNKDTTEFRYYVETIIENGIDNNELITYNKKVKNKDKTDNNIKQLTIFDSNKSE